jgi:BlaI family transcriptional regulator, penicillinase repressor
MAKAKAGDFEQPLGHRERQIMDAIYRLGTASVSDVLDALPDPPSYSAVRKMINVLEDKGLVEHTQRGTKYIYRAVRSRHSASRNAVKHLLSTFFQGSVSDAVNMMIDMQSNKLTSEELTRLESIIEQARKEGK